MNQRPASDIAFTTSVKQIQTEKGSRETYARMAKLADWKTRVDGPLRDFLQSLDMF